MLIIITNTFSFIKLLLLLLSLLSTSAVDPIKFLKSYGYIKTDHVETNARNKMSFNGHRDVILKMQHYANIPMTGNLDQTTINKMSQPRCGSPDVRPLSKSVSTVFDRRTRNKRFVIYGSKWPSNLITWSLIMVNGNASSKVRPEIIRAELHRAFEIWSKGSNNILRFQELENNDKANIKISFHVGDHGCGPRNAFDGPGRKLAHAFAPTKGDIHFDDSEDWDNTKDNGISLFWTALHEIGHSLGFAHTADPLSIMFPYYQIRKDPKLPNVDRAGVMKLYGNESPVAPTESPDSSPPDSRPDVPTHDNDTRNDADEPFRVACNTNIDAIATIRGDIFVFKNTNFWWIKSHLEMRRREASSISSYFYGFPNYTNVDAAYERRKDGKILFFVGQHYYTFDGNTRESGPNSIMDFGLYDNYGQPIEKLDAIFDWGHSGRTFIFARDSYGQSLYWRLNDEETHVLKKYPQLVSTTWENVPTPIDTAFTRSDDSATYFFKGTQYWKFDNSRMTVERGYPKFIQNLLFRELNCPPNASPLTSFANGSLNFDIKASLLYVIIIRFIYFLIL